jgi:hypothetical protein
MHVVPAKGRRRNVISGFPGARDAYSEYLYESMILSSLSTQPLIDHSVISECRYGDENQASEVAIFPSHNSSLPSITLRVSDIEYLAIHAAFTQCHGSVLSLRHLGLVFACATLVQAKLHVDK